MTAQFETLGMGKYCTIPSSRPGARFALIVVEETAEILWQATGGIETWTVKSFDHVEARDFPDHRLIVFVGSRHRVLSSEAVRLVHVVSRFTAAGRRCWTCVPPLIAGYSVLSFAELLEARGLRAVRRSNETQRRYWRPTSAPAEPAPTSAPAGQHGVGVHSSARITVRRMGSSKNAADRSQRRTASDAAKAEAHARRVNIACACPGVIEGQHAAARRAAATCVAAGPYAHCGRAAAVSDTRPTPPPTIVTARHRHR